MQKVRLMILAQSAKKQHLSVDDTLREKLGRDVHSACYPGLARRTFEALLAELLNRSESASGSSRTVRR